MIEFEWYIKRAKIDLNLFFKVENINSDEDLIEYCKLKNLSIPKSKYFPDPEPEPVEQAKQLEVIKPKTTRRKRVKKEAQQPKEAESKDSKPPQKTRRRTTRKKTTK